MSNRPHPERFVAAGRVLLLIAGGRLHDGAESLREGAQGALRSSPAAIALVGRTVVDGAGRVIRGSGEGLRRAAGRVERVVEG
jgi:hypothetical protein